MSVRTEGAGAFVHQSLCWPAEGGSWVIRAQALTPLLHPGKSKLSGLKGKPQLGSVSVGRNTLTETALPGNTPY